MTTANVGLFYGVHILPVVPDVLLSLDVKAPEDWSQKKNRSYFVWEIGKVPEVAIEIVSNRVGNELSDKLTKYAQIGVAYYVVFDPLTCLSDEVLQVYQLVGFTYQRQPNAWLGPVGLGLTLWDGNFEGAYYHQWLRWCDQSGQVLCTGDEKAAAAQDQAAIAQNQAVMAQEQAAIAQERAEQLATLLREQGIDPENI